MHKSTKLFFITTAAISILLISAAILQNGTPSASADETEWRLEITGLVNKPLNLTLTDLAAMPLTTVPATIYCVDFPKIVVETGNWTGVQLEVLLETAGISPSATKIAFYAADGYTTDLTLDAAKEPYVIIAFEKDGDALGNSLRLVVPGRWGYKWISQLTKIEVVNYDFKGKWESRGYSDDGIQTTVPEITWYPQGPVTDTNPPPSTTTPPPADEPASNSSTTPPTQETQTPTTETPETQTEPFPILPIATALVVIVAAVSSAFLILRRRRKQ